MQLISAPKSQWNVTQSYLNKKPEAQLKELRKLKPKVSDSLPPTKEVRLSHIPDVVFTFTLNNGEYYLNGTSLTDYLLNIKKNHDNSSLSGVLKVNII